jgi:hypothetical protein
MSLVLTARYRVSCRGRTVRWVVHGHETSNPTMAHLYKLPFARFLEAFPPPPGGPVGPVQAKGKPLAIPSNILFSSEKSFAAPFLLAVRFGEVRAMPPRWVHRDGCGPPAPHEGRPALRIPVDYLDGPQAVPVSLRPGLPPSPLEPGSPLQLPRP